MTISRNIGRGGKRAGAGRPRKVIPPAEPAAEGPFDPIATLEGIAADSRQTGAARVAACRAILVHRDGEPESAGDAITRKALEIMSRRPN